MTNDTQQLYAGLDRDAADSLAAAIQTTFNNLQEVIFGGGESSENSNNTGEGSQTWSGVATILADNLLGSERVSIEKDIAESINHYLTQFHTICGEYLEFVTTNANYIIERINNTTGLGVTETPLAKRTLDTLKAATWNSNSTGTRGLVNSDSETVLTSTVSGFLSAIENSALAGVGNISAIQGNIFGNKDDVLVGNLVKLCRAMQTRFEELNTTLAANIGVVTGKYVDIATAMASITEATSSSAE